MNDPLPPDWDPRADAVLQDQLTAYDDMRARCPVAYSDFLGWSLFRHADVTRVLHDPATFSNVVSRRRAVPNGMDPPEHTEFRRILDPYFAPERMAAFEPACRQIAASLTQGLLERDEVELVAEYAQSFALQVQCAFLGWPPDMREALRSWTRKNQAATQAQDRARMTQIAGEFDGYINELLRVRRKAGAAASEDFTTSLLRVRVRNRPLRDEEIVSILRNATAGEVGTIAAAVGILVHFLAENPEAQRQLREQPSVLPAAIEEILRIHGPLVANRRVTTRAVEIGGRRIGAGEPVSIIWISANRDERVFEDPKAFRPDRDAAPNLLYGAGIHVCPGAPLARLEMRVAMEELLGRTTRIEPSRNRTPTKATYPASGFVALPLRVR
ncbi:MAG: cytochrome P450 [Burkholderiales bacterium]